MIVVFDTNTYRTIVNSFTSQETVDYFADINELQAHKNVNALMSTTVAMELIAHLYDNNAFYPEGDCTKAVRALYTHCGDNSQYGVLPLPHVQISRDYFHTQDEASVQMQHTVGLICHAIWEEPNEDTARKYQQQITQINMHIQDTEQTVAKYLRAMATEWRKSTDSEEDKKLLVGDLHIAALIAETARKNGIRILDDSSIDGIRSQFQTFFNMYREQYKAPLRMIENICVKMSDGHYIPDKPKRLNQIWDQQILHGAGQAINGEYIVIVTSDKEMLQAARETATEPAKTPFIGNVATKEEYLAWLNA